jgi:hypothetical protein
MAHDETIQERVQELTWALVDDQLDADEMRLLETLLISDDKARDTYVHCVQLHADLMGHFAPASAPTAAGKSPVLSFLGQAGPTIDAQPAQQ